MNSPGTHEGAFAFVASAVGEANLAALKSVLPRSAECIRAAQAPASVRLTAGRDGQPTYCWMDESGRLRWLGRTSTPSISSAALVDAFQAGNRNVLLVGMGQGAEVDLLLRRLAPYQAIMVIEETAWAVGLSLGLYDLARDLRNGRLLLFVGPAAWDDFRRLLLDHDGYLTPERMLSWPWFDANAIADITNRLLEVSRQVAQDRAAKHAAAGQSRRAELTPDPKGPIAILSNVSQVSVRELAVRISAAAHLLGRPCKRFVLEDPTMVHPFVVERALAELRPALLLLLDAGPDSLQYELPPAQVLVMCSHRHGLPQDCIRQLPAAAWLGLSTESQRRQAIESGLAESRLLWLPPAAIAGSDNQERRAAPTSDGFGKKEGEAEWRVLVIADGCDVSSEAAGLHLASHCRLWEAATTVIRERCETYCNEDAPGVLTAAEDKLGIRLDSDEVRGGIVDRIRHILGPGIVRRAYCLALLEAGVSFDLYGEGWQDDPLLAGCCGGGWPPPDGMHEALKGGGLAISFEPSGGVDSALLDCLAGGLAGVLRAHPLDATTDGLSAVLDPDKHVWRFRSTAELLKLVKGFLTNPQVFRERAEAAARHVNAHHTWARRLESIFQACGIE